MLALVSKIKSALFYPMSIIIMAFVITAVIMIFVIPAFKEVFKSFGADLPAPTVMVMPCRTSSSSTGISFSARSVAVYAFIQAYKRSEAMQITFDRLALKAPIFGDVIRKSTRGPVDRTLATMFAAGVPLVESLDSVGGASGNYVAKGRHRNRSRAKSRPAPT